MKTLMMYCLATVLCVGLPLGTAGAQDNPAPATDEAAIRACVLDYLEGWFTSSPERMERALHPNLFKVRIEELPGTGAEILDTVDAETMVTYTAHNQSWVAGKEGFKNLEILFNDGRIAVVHAVSSGFYDVIGLVKINQEWKILQVLWDVNQE